MSSYRNDSTSSGSGKTIFGAVASIIGGLVLCALLIAGCNTVPPGNVGLQVSKIGSSRGVSDVPVKTGFVLLNPITSELVVYPIYVRTIKWTASTDEGKNTDESITFNTKDSMQVNADISISYQLDPDSAAKFYVKYRADNIDLYSDGLLRNIARESFNDVTSNYTVDQIIGPESANILKAVRDLIQTKVGPDGIKIEQLGFLGAPRPPKNVQDAINYKVQAQQIGLQKEAEVAQSQADAKKREAEAEGVAQSNLILADADAKANALRNQSLTPLLIEWKEIDKWNGQKPSTVVLSGSANPNVILKP